MDVFEELLQQVHCDYHIEYGGFLSNHAMHGLVAIFATLGDNHASAKRLPQWMEAYRHHVTLGAQLQPPEPRGREITTEIVRSEEDFFQKKNFLGYYDFFRSEISKAGRVKAVCEFMPILAKGVVGSALHCLIHLGFALEIHHCGGSDAACDMMTAEALAYLVYGGYDVGEPLPKPPADEEALTAIEIVTKIRQDSSIAAVFEIEDGNNFQERIRKLMRSDACGDIVRPLTSRWTAIKASFDEKIPLRDRIETLTDAIVRTVVTVHTLTGATDFFLAHGVTSAYAIFRIVRTVLADDSIVENALQSILLMLRYYWLSVVVVYIVQGCAPLLSYESVRDGTTSRDWDWIVQQGVMTENEEHVIKVAFACKYWAENDYKEDEEFVKLLHLSANVAAQHVSYEYEGKERAGWDSYFVKLFEGEDRDCLNVFQRGGEHKEE